MSHNRPTLPLYFFGCLQGRVRLLETYQLSKEGPSELKRIVSGEVASNKALIGLQVSSEKRLTTKTQQLQHFLVCLEFVCCKIA